MGWEERVREAAYTSPNGNRLTFDFEDLAVEWTKRTTAYDFANVDGTYIQSRGRSGRRFPMVCYFHGDDHDIEAKGFMTLLNEDGFGRLEHPFYDPADVIPFGEITRRDDLKTAANQTIFEVQFWETLGVIYPSPDADLSGTVAASVDDFNAASAAQLEAQIDLVSEAETITFKDRVESFLGEVSAATGRIAATTEKVNDQFNQVNDSINRGIDVLVRDPLTLAFQTKIAIQAPARAQAAIRDRLKAYGDLAADIFGRPDATSSDANKFLTRDLFASGYVSGSVVACINHQFDTRSEALEAAQTLLDQWDDYADWVEANWEALAAVDTTAIPAANLVDPGGQFQSLLDAVGLAAGFLVQISFTLKQERAVVLTRPRNIIELGYELYGEGFEADDNLDFFINSNNLSGSEILEIPKGRKIKYYV